MKIALYYAMPKELESLLTSAEAHHLQTLSGVPFYAITDDIIAFAGGVGKVNAAMSTQLCIQCYHPDLIIDCGVAGCFEDLPIGTLMFADRFCQHDVDTTGCGDPIGLVSTVNCIEFPVSYVEEAKRAFAKAGLDYRLGLGATGDWFAKKGARAAFIRETFSPLFIEMEGGAIAQVCLRNQVSFMAIKSVSDCLFTNDDYDFNFPKAIEHFNRLVMQWIQNLELSDGKNC